MDKRLHHLELGRAENPKLLLLHGLGMGHKYSIPGQESENDSLSLAESFERSRDAFAELIVKFLENGRPVDFGNTLYRYISG